ALASQRRLMSEVVDRFFRRGVERSVDVHQGAVQVEKNRLESVAGQTRLRAPRVTSRSFYLSILLVRGCQARPAHRKATAKRPSGAQCNSTIDGLAAALSARIAPSASSRVCGVAKSATPIFAASCAQIFCRARIASARSRLGGSAKP